MPKKLFYEVNITYSIVGLKILEHKEILSLAKPERNILHRGWDDLLSPLPPHSVS